MSARTNTAKSRSAAQRAARIAVSREKPTAEAISPRLWTAFGLLAAASLLLGASQPLGLITPTGDQGFLAFPLLLVLALAPVGAVLWLLIRGKSTFAAGVLTALGLIALGRGVIDAQIAVNAGLISRPEFQIQIGPTKPPVGPGFWSLIAGHLLTVFAGLLALTLLRGLDAGGTRQRGLMGIALPASLLAFIGLLMPPFQSDNPLLPAESVLDAPPLVLAGGLLLAVSLPVAAAFAASSSNPAAARGGLFGLGVGLAVVTLPQLASGLFVAQLHPAPGPYLALVGAIVLVGSVGMRDGSQAVGKVSTRRQVRTLATQRLAQLVAGILGVIAGVASVIAANVAQLTLPPDLLMPENYSSRLLIPASALAVLFGVMMLISHAGLVSHLALLVRPAFIVNLVAIPFAAASSIDAAIAATAAPGIEPGPGCWLAGIAALLALAAMVPAALVGAFERDEIDLGQLMVRRNMLVPIGAAMLCAIGTFWFPIVTAPNYAPPDLWSNFRFTSWGLLVALAAVLIACAIALRSRPQRAAALLFGSAMLIGVRLLEFPMTIGRFPTSTFGVGGWFALACLVILIGTGFASPALSHGESR